MHASTPKTSRRSLLARGAGLAVAALAAGPMRPLFAAGARWFKIGACEWNLQKADPTSFDVAKQIGLDGVQINMGSTADDMHLRKPEVQKAYLEAMKRTGLGAGSLAMGELNNVGLKNDPRAEAWLLEAIDVCKAMNIPIVMPACFYKGDLDMSKTDEIDHLVVVLKKACAKAEKAGITIGIENYLNARDNLKILDRVGSNALAVYYDVGNSTDKGYNIYEEIPLLGKRICEFHFKDGNHMLGQGRIDFAKVRKAIDAIEYSGWIQIEAAAPHGLVPDYRAHYKFIRKHFPERG